MSCIKCLRPPEKYGGGNNRLTVVMRKNSYGLISVMRGSLTRYKQEHKSDIKAQNPLDVLKQMVKLVFRSIGAGDEMKCLRLGVMFDIYQV